MKILFLSLLLIAASIATPAAARSSSGSHASARARSSSKSSAATTRRSPSTKCSSCARTPSGRIQRSRVATGAFKKQSPCPSTGKTSGSCPGYVIDHVKPLKRGGADAPGNMQWQTKEAAKAKDKVE